MNLSGARSRKNRVEIVNPGGLVSGLEFSELGKSSMPRNPLLFGLLYRMDLVEHVGSGLNRIRTAMKAEGRPAPKIEANANGFSISFQRTRKDSREKGPVEKTVEKTREKTREKILRLLKEKPMITTAEVAGILGLTRKGVEWQVRKAREMGLLRRTGPDKGGSWVVISQSF